MNSSSQINDSFLICSNIVLRPSEALSHQQAQEFCVHLSTWSRVTVTLDATIGYSMIIAGIIGLFGSCLMLSTFLHKSMASPGYSYYRAISTIEILHVSVLIEYGVIRCLHFPPSEAMRVWNLAFAYGWSIGDWVKLIVAALTVFVSLERFMAIWVPMTFAAVVDRSRAAYTAIGLSIGLGSIHGFTFVLFIMSIIDGTGKTYDSTFAQIQNSIGYIKLTLCAILATLTVSVVVGLRMKAKKLAKLKNKKEGNISNHEKEQWKSTKLRCYLMLILSVSTLVDHVAWFSYRMLALKTDEATLPADGTASYESAVTYLEYRKLTDCVEVVQVITGELLHCGKFYLYFALHSGFRKAFFKVFSRNKIDTTTLATRTQIQSQYPQSVSATVQVAPAPSYQ